MLIWYGSEVLLMTMAVATTSLPPVYERDNKGNLLRTPYQVDSSLIYNRTQTETSRIIPQTDTQELFSIMSEEGISTLIVENEYGTMKVSLVNTKEEVRRVVGMYKKALSLFVSFGAISFGAFTSFVALGITGTISPFLSIVGSVFMGSITTAIYADYRKWEKDYA
jgi:hypothetical protein